MGATAPNATTQRIVKRRQRVKLLVEKGLSEREIATEIGTSRSTVWSDKQVLRAEGRLL